MDTLSLFDGISCGQLAKQRIGMDGKYYASEINPDAIKVTQHNFPNTIQIGDVKKVNGKDYKGIDMLIGGSPCQGFSTSGKQLNFEDPRSKLFFEYVRILEECNPRYFLLENVVMKQEYQDVITNHLGVKPILIDSALVSAQSRKRLYWTNIPNVVQPEDKGIELKDIIKTERKPINLVPFVIEKLELIEKKYGYIPHIFNPYNLSEILDKSPCLTAQGDSQTKSSSVILRYKDGYSMLDADEWELLQTIPLGYTSILRRDGKRKNVLGNAWTVDVIAHILNFIKEEKQ